MKTEKTDLRQRIDTYSPDDPSATFPYSARLARDNGWSPSYAHRVVEEYKRFAYLAMTAGHPVTPSDQVDQAWHLHMIYTRSYWIEFCRDILGSPLHHSPTKGGGSEQGKFVDWYEHTLESYRRLLKMEPPADIWPPASRRFGEDIRFLRVNAERNWVLRKPRWWRWLATRPPARIRAARSHRPATAALALASLVAFAGCQQLVGAGVIAWRISSAYFIPLFVALGALGIILASALRLSLCDTGDRPRSPLDIYSAGYLAGGSSRLFDAIVVSLVHSEHLVFDKKGATLSRTESPSTNLHPLERSVCDLIPPAPATAKVADLRRSVEPPFAPIGNALCDSGLLLSKEQADRATRWPMLIALIAPIAGLLRCLYGLSQDKPIGYVGILTLLFGMIALAGFMIRPSRSRAGDQKLQRLRRKHSERPSPTICWPPSDCSAWPACRGRATLILHQPSLRSPTAAAVGAGAAAVGAGAAEMAAVVVAAGAEAEGDHLPPSRSTQRGYRIPDPFWSLASSFDLGSREQWRWASTGIRAWLGARSCHERPLRDAPGRTHPPH